MIYPVGAVYTSTVEVDPSLLFGGTWERIEGRFLLAADSTYTAGATGGEAEHLLTVDEAPRIEIPYADSDTGSGNVALTASSVYSAVAASDLKKFMQFTRRNEQVAHNNMPPYLAVYMWQRTA